MSQVGRRCRSGALVVLIVLAAALPSADAAARRRGTITKRFANPAAILVPANPTAPQSGAATAAPYPATITVGGFKRGRPKDVDLRLVGFSHTWPDDVDILLVAPDGRSAKVWSDVGGGRESAVGLTVTIDDEATAPLPTNGQLRPRAYRPANDNGAEPDTFDAPAPAPTVEVALSTFDGIDPNGTWRLFVMDDGGGWGLTITGRVR